MTPLHALQVTLAGEHAAMYVYTVLGGQVSASEDATLAAALTSAYDAHRAQRDTLTALITRAGGSPVAADPAYTLPNAAGNAAQQRAAALQIEKRCSTLYGQLVANSAGANRRQAISMLTAGAVRRIGFGDSPAAFPGYAD